ncbi:HAD hydrolase-like protein [Paenibacillus athensensis]|uniref:HAD family hydrolase n=1 Tax=Paenibacillus athensensis TaxID=1967502 RepID=A0A4Y8Q151_9BACL|nr:HAD hydrolase-like protein [Paenibacillus athensensis]MCD1261118.1 HAD hydrolase-like protein [Paenibacillus athensensis]
MRRHLLFDFDGTLVDSRALIVQLYNDIAAEHGFRSIQASDLQLLRTLSTRERIAHLRVPLVQIPRLAVTAKQRYHDNVSRLHTVPGMRETVGRLLELGGRLSIVSSNSAATIRAFLKGRRMDDAFSEVISVKPLLGKQHAIGKYLKRHGLRAAQAMYVGDELRDIEACRKLGMPIAAVTWGYDDVRLLRSGSPDYIVDSPQELLRVLAARLATRSK